MQLKKNKNSLKDEIDAFIINWNNRFPVDRWWRNKYKVAFGSEQHKQMNFITMFIDYEEEKVFRKIEKDKDPDNVDMFANDKIQKLSKSEIDKEFEDLDISEFNKK